MPPAQLALIVHPEHLLPHLVIVLSGFGLSPLQSLFSASAPLITVPLSPRIQSRIHLLVTYTRVKESMSGNQIPTTILQYQIVCTYEINS